MAVIDFSKFRFRVGDIVNYKDHNYKICAYYFSSGFNNYDHAYGYVIDYPCHNGSTYSYNQYGKKVKFETNRVHYVREKDISFIKFASYIDIYNIRPGDSVRILPRKYRNYYACYNDLMTRYADSIEVVKSISYIDENLVDNAKIVCRMDDIPYSWTDQMFEIIQPNMEQKELKITIPEGYEIDKENSTFECIKFKRKELTYEDIAERLKGDNNIHFYSLTDAQSDKLKALHKLMIVADYLNNGWKPDWRDANQMKYVICLSPRPHICTFTFDVYSPVVFKSEEAAYQAIKILGEDIIKSALL